MDIISDPWAAANGVILSYSDIDSKLEFVGWNRVSGPSGAGKRKRKLTDKEVILRNLAEMLIPGRVKYINSAQESGRMDKDRPEFERTIQEARDMGCGVVARGPSRFIRPRSDGDFGLLKQLAQGVPLVALIIREQAGDAIRFSGQAGRPKKIDGGLWDRIIADLWPLYRDEKGQWHGRVSLKSVAEKHGVSRFTIKRVLFRYVQVNFPDD
jgi:hypothetical protein